MIRTGPRDRGHNWPHWLCGAEGWGGGGGSREYSGHNWPHLLCGAEGVGGGGVLVDTADTSGPTGYVELREWGVGGGGSR